MPPPPEPPRRLLIAASSPHAEAALRVVFLLRPLPPGYLKERPRPPRGHPTAPQPLLAHLPRAIARRSFPLAPTAAGLLQKSSPPTTISSPPPPRLASDPSWARGPCLPCRQQ